MNLLPSLSQIGLPEADRKPICPHFYQCGGCQLQDISYHKQLAFKQAWLENLLSPLGTLPWLPMIGEGSDAPTYFRNKMRYGFVYADESVCTSRHAKVGDFDIPVQTCLLQSEESMHIVHRVAEHATKYGWLLFEPTTSTGHLKHILVREAQSGTMVGIVTSGGTIPEHETLVSNLKELTTSLWHIETDGRRAESSQDTLLWGEPVILEKVGEYEFRISLHAFFQTNRTMLPELYEAILRACHLSNVKTIWDLYAGSATIGAWLSKRVTQVISVEINPANIADAKWNISRNHLSNIEIREGESETFLNLAKEAPDVVVVDPPRAGLSAQAIASLIRLKPRRFVYTSCNPHTFLRDALKLKEAGFVPASFQGIDMFPHTLHCELVAAFTFEKT